MKIIRRPVQVELTPSYRYTIKTKEQYQEFDRVWKQLVQENRKKSYNNQFASLSILRNIILGRCMYTGFTPALRVNDLKNGRGFCGGFARAFNNLQEALTDDRHTHLQNSCYRLLYSFGSPSKVEMKKCFPNKLDMAYAHYPFMKNYISRVQKMIIDMKENGRGDELKGLSYTQLFDLADEECLFNVMRKDQYEKLKDSVTFQGTLEKFGEDYLNLVKEKDVIIDNVVLDDDIIQISTVNKYQRTPNKSTVTTHSLPVSHLWEVEWLEKYAR